jgi:hypothetical protein
MCLCNFSAYLNKTFAVEPNTHFVKGCELSIYNGPTNALVCNKTLIQMSHTKTLKITATCFDNQMIIIRELFDPG